MKYEDFVTLETEEEKKAYFESLEEKSILYDDMEAERDSFKAENEKLIKESGDLQKEMKKTKELNFTLARTVGREGSQAKKDPEELLHEMFLRGGKKP